MVRIVVGVAVWGEGGWAGTPPHAGFFSWI
jgi:hypothetical protein